MSFIVMKNFINLSYVYIPNIFYKWFIVSFLSCSASKDDPRFQRLKSEATKNYNKGNPGRGLTRKN